MTRYVARAHVNWGRWIARCPRDLCTNAMRLERHQGTYVCAGAGGCGLQCGVEWPSDADEIWEALLERPVPNTRNWYPKGDPIAVLTGSPHGQSAAELREEQRQHELAELTGAL